MNRIRYFWLALFLGFCLAGCSKHTTSYVHQGVDFSFIRRVAVFPFQNLSNQDKAGARLQSVFMAKLLEKDGIEVVNPGETHKGILEQYIDMEGDPTPAQMIQLGRRLGVQGVFFGVVEDYGVDRLSNNRSHTVTATFRLVETETGNVVWNCQVYVGGTSLWQKLFGGGAPSMYAVSGKAVDQAMGTLF